MIWAKNFHSIAEPLTCKSEFPCWHVYVIYDDSDLLQVTTNTGLFNEEKMVLMPGTRAISRPTDQQGPVKSANAFICTFQPNELLFAFFKVTC